MLNSASAGNSSENNKCTFPVEFPLFQSSFYLIHLQQVYEGLIPSHFVIFSKRFQFSPIKWLQTKDLNFLQSFVLFQSNLQSIIHESLSTRKSSTQSFPAFIFYFVFVGWKPNSFLFNLAGCWRLWLSTSLPTLVFLYYIYSSDQKPEASFMCFFAENSYQKPP